MDSSRTVVAVAWLMALAVLAAGPAVALALSATGCIGVIVGSGPDAVAEACYDGLPATRSVQKTTAQGTGTAGATFSDSGFRADIADRREPNAMRVVSSGYAFFTPEVDTAYEIVGRYGWTKPEAGTVEVQVWLREQLANPVSIFEEVHQSRLTPNESYIVGTPGGEGYSSTGASTGVLLAGRLYFWGYIVGSARDLGEDQGATGSGVMEIRLRAAAVLVPPVANAGPDQAIHAGQTVLLNGTGSSDDNTPTEQLLFAWTLAERPAGSAAALVGADTATPTFVADRSGTYTASLIVTDGDNLSSAAATVVISSLNANPSANAGLDQGTFVGHPVTLDGSLSYDPDSDPLAYSWALAGPAGSAAVLTGSATGAPGFTPDVPGIYTATLTVRDGLGGAGVDSVQVSVVTVDQYGATRAMTALNEVGALAPGSVTNRGNQRALQNSLAKAIEELQAGDRAKATRKLTDALERTDGCVLRGVPDAQGAGRDWVTDCVAQATVYTAIRDALDALGP